MKNKFIFIFLIILSFFFSKIILAANDENIYDKIDLFGEVLDKINKEYVEEIDQSDAMDAAINGVLQSLDPYSAYMSPQTFKEMETETSGKFGGLGIEVGMEFGVVKVITPMDDSPAEREGVKAGDYIVKINGIQVQGKTLSEAVELMRGPVGSKLEITIRRKGVKKALVFEITREIIEVKSVKSKIIDDSVGYIRLTAFNENSSKQIKNKIKKFKKNKINKYVLDLRNNPGGLLSQAVKISDFFLDNGEIVSTKSRKSSENRKYFAKKGDIINGKTLVVLINYGSASASEIVAGALKDHKRAILIGKNSYGKGSVQSIIPLKNKGAIRLTISKYYLPSGKSISGTGITPDIEVAESSDEFRIGTETDNQLDFAITLLNG
jgi:carboxyl-terminal processing protease|tara:strand:+ start:1373 stop:2512 length:1140 start_codon:yes stop_codon:yes gene_type:complete